jgi:signal transduction histidine kinase
VELRIEPGHLCLHVEDDGCGFEPEDAFASRQGNFGVIGMRERAERIKGELHLDSHRGKGTRIDVTVPLR